MSIQLISALTLGLLAYWLFKMRGEIRNSTPTSTVEQFWAAFRFNILLSLIGYALVLINGPVLPFDWGNISGVGPAFVLGGALPSLINNFEAAFLKPKS